MNTARCRTLIYYAALALTAQVHADERILDFHSDIRVNPDSSLDVTETIRVLADGTRIKHGITRMFPTDYPDAYGNAVHVGFEMISAERQHYREIWRSEPFENGVRIYLGDPDTIVAAGAQEYTLHYRTTRQLGFFPDHDELYWNVTGNGWNFVIDHASADVTLPSAIPSAQITLTAYTGVQGAKGRNFKAAADKASHALFETTAPLSVREGLSIVVGFPKGFVTPPDGEQQLRWLLADNAHIVVGCLGLLAVLVYFLIVWWRVGRDPRAGPIVPQYEAPDGLTPGSLRFVELESYDDRCFAADLVDLGVRGALQIRQAGRDYVLKNVAQSADDLPDIELKLHNNLLDGRDELELKQAQQPIIGKARSAHAAQIATSCGAVNFNTHSDKLLIGALLSVATIFVVDAIVGVHLQSSTGHDAPIWVLLFASVFLFVFAGGAAYLGQRIWAAWRKAARSGSNYAAALPTSLFAGCGFLICAGIYTAIGSPAGYFGVGLALALLLVFIIFSELLPAPTIVGRKLLDKIQGLRLYLSVAERDELARMQTPQMTEREFQRFLPYALALDVEKNWTDRFAAVVGPAAVAASAAAMTWYYGDQGNFANSNFDNFATNLGNSLSNTIASSATAPGSSSGSGGGDGGSSGGGGGGGGGDGW